MNHVVIKRISTSDSGTIGDLTTKGFSCKTIELPWRDNKPFVSCIPTGKYICDPHASAKFGDVYILKNVPGRSDVLIHAGNYAGDKSKGLRADTEGCIILGKKYGTINGQPVVLISRPVVKDFINHMGWDSFLLEIV